MTAKEYLYKDENYQKVASLYPELNKTIQESLVGFATYHVMAFQRALYLKIQNDLIITGEVNIDLDFIIETYPMSNIKEN